MERYESCIAEDEGKFDRSTSTVVIPRGVLTAAWYPRTCVAECSTTVILLWFGRASELISFQLRVQGQKLHGYGPDRPKEKVQMQMQMQPVTVHCSITISLLQTAFEK